MKNSFLLFAFLATFNLSFGQWTHNSGNNTLTTNNYFTGIGSNGTGTYDYHFRFFNNLNLDKFFLSLDNEAKKHIFSVGYDSNSTYISLNNRYGNELFKTGILDNDNRVYMHMPKADSRIVIGSWGSYLINEGHKFVIKNGSAKIEGNIFTTENIGIGTTSFTDGSDNYRLSVNGRVRAHAVKVYTSWADYVFDKDYYLPTLLEVENYIKENGHLKDIPSAEEVEENGIELGEMNKLLLQKIEELTLYTIQLKKEIEELKSKID